MLTMKYKQTLAIVAAIAFFPSVAIASDIRIRTGSVEASTSKNGSIYVNTGNSKVQVPARRTFYWNPFRYWRSPRQNANCRHNTYQKTTHVSQSGSRVVQSNVATRTCY